MGKPMEFTIEVENEVLREENSKILEIIQLNT